jgi:pyruvate/2-oxoglutarate dehydrogenase complex dihydrolipoamide dehydrogenase (E3) component
MERQDLVVIGGGTSGFIVATGALRSGLKVTLIEKKAYLGGLALHFGCVPSKTLLHVAQVAHTIRNAGQYGLVTGFSPIDLSKVNRHIGSVIDGLEKQDDQETQNIFDQLGGKLLFGQPRFIDPHTIQIEDTKIRAKTFVIATGSAPMFPTIKGLDHVGYITSDIVFSQRKLPQKLIILGGNSAAIEFAQAFARMGTKVTVIVEGDSILAQEDPELVNHLKDYLVHEGVDFYLSTKVEAAYLQRQKKYLECAHDSGDKFDLFADEILVCMGRKPRVEGLGLDNARVSYDCNGIIVNKKLQTSHKHIYALGDVIRSPYKLSHAAEYQANIVLSNAVFGYSAKVKYQGFPYVVFTNPEYAHVGLSEQQAKELGCKKIEVSRFAFKDLDSAVIQNLQKGLIKVISHKGKIIGATILGPQASNLIAEWGLAINLGAKVADVAATIHAYPTLAQISRRVANKYVTKGLFTRSKGFAGLWQKVFA